MTTLRAGMLALALLAGVSAPAMASITVPLSVGAASGFDSLDGVTFNDFTFVGANWQVGYDGDAVINRAPSTSSLVYSKGSFDFLGITLSALNSDESLTVTGTGSLKANFYDAAHTLLGTRTWSLDRNPSHVSFSDSILGVNTIEFVNPRSAYYLNPRVLDLTIAGAVPEPETWALTGLGLTTLLLRLRRRKTAL